MENQIKEPTFQDIMTALLAPTYKRIAGYVYAVEYEDGKVKIGSTQNMKKRIYSLQHSYRDIPMKIVKVFVSEMVNDCREAERRSMYGLKSCEKNKKELFNISFEHAVERIKMNTNNGGPEAFAISRDGVLSQYENLMDYQESLEALEKAVSAFFQRKHAIESHADTMI